jgi:hypothetical protein
MWIGLVFAFLGIFGSALPGHLGMRVLAYHEHLDRKLPFTPNTEQGGLSYGWWLMRFGHKAFPKATALNQFGTLAGVFGWITLIALIATTFCFILSKSGL